MDRALEAAALPEGRRAACERITLVLDNFDTHAKGAFHTAFEASRARDPMLWIAFCYTAKHGSRLNVAESALIAITRQCLSGRLVGEIGTLREEIAAWSVDPSTRQRDVDWRMKIDDARCKLKSIYPKIKLLQSTRSVERLW